MSSPPPGPLTEPNPKRVVAFFDGQNLFHAAREAFGHRMPNYDPPALVKAVCGSMGWHVVGVRFYTGLPGAKEEPFWHRYWASKLRGMRTAGVEVVTRPLRYRAKDFELPSRGGAGQSRLRLPDRSILPPDQPLYTHDGRPLPDGTVLSSWVGEEKGIDVRLALDLIRLAHDRAYDVALVFSQDQDLAEAADEVRRIAREQARWLQPYSAYPCGPSTRNTRGVDRTTWIKLDQATYDACLDPRPHGARRA